MKVLFLEYGSTICEFAGFFATFGVLKKLLLAWDCKFAGIVAFWILGGC